jgi:uncharacterized protein GlcG (DUF336 family)
MRLQRVESGCEFSGCRSEHFRKGGVPIFVDGKLIGAVGVSGVLPQQDGQVAGAAAAGLK